MLALNQVSRIFPGGAEALRGIDLEVGAGEIVAMVGGSGCGKTTLLRLIAGLDRASAGALRFEGRMLDGPSPEIGLIFQEPRLLPWLSVEDNIGFGLADLPKAERTSRVESAILRVGLGGLGKRWPRQLSGGQAQRVAIARALVARPKLMLLDEPFSALDAFTRATLHEHLIALWGAEGLTLVLVTHDVEEAAVLADRVIVMQPHPGRLFAEIPLGLPRPRDRAGAAFNEAKRAILAALDGSLQAEQSRHPKTVETPAAFWW